jgi:cytochrome P450
MIYGPIDVDEHIMGAFLANNTPLTYPSYRPPAPSPRPNSLGAFRLMVALKRNPLECWADAHFEKPVVAGGLPFTHVLLVNEPRAIARVLLENAANYRKDSLQRRILSAGLGDGLLSAEGEQWRIQRRTLAPVFARKNITAFAPDMMRAAQALVERWRAQQQSIIDVSSEMSRLTLEVLQQTIFSDGLGRDAEQFRIAMRTYFDTIGRIDPLDVLGVPAFVPRTTHWRVRSTLRFFESAIDDIIRTRRSRMSASTNTAPNDILTLLLRALDPDTGSRMSEIEVRSNILTFIAAGHETTANLLTWALFLLSQSSDWRERIEAECERELGGVVEGMAGRLHLTRAVLDEAARLYPPIAAISRVAVDADELAGEPVKRGSLVVIAPYVLHRHRLLWPDPDRFDPGRFLGTQRDAIHRYAYLPFGAGARTCIGSAFALQEATLVLAVIIQNFRLQLAAGKRVWPMLRVTLRPEHGMPMMISAKIPRIKARMQCEADYRSPNAKSASRRAPKNF